MELTDEILIEKEGLVKSYPPCSRTNLFPIKQLDGKTAREPNPPKENSTQDDNRQHFSNAFKGTEVQSVTTDTSENINMYGYCPVQCFFPETNLWTV